MFSTSRYFFFLFKTYFKPFSLYQISSFFNLQPTNIKLINFKLLASTRKAKVKLFGSPYKLQLPTSMLRSKVSSATAVSFGDCKGSSSTCSSDDDKFPTLLIKFVRSASAVEELQESEAYRMSRGECTMWRVMESTCCCCCRMSIRSNSVCIAPTIANTNHGGVPQVEASHSCTTCIGISSFSPAYAGMLYTDMSSAPL